MLKAQLSLASEGLPSSLPHPPVCALPFLPICALCLVGLHPLSPEGLAEVTSSKMTFLCSKSYVLGGVSLPGSVATERKLTCHCPPCTEGSRVERANRVWAKPPRCWSACAARPGPALATAGPLLIWPRQQVFRRPPGTQNRGF